MRTVQKHQQYYKIWFWQLLDLTKHTQVPAVRIAALTACSGGAAGWDPALDINSDTCPAPPQVLDLTGGNAVSAVGIASLAGCRELRSLALTWCIRYVCASLPSPL